MEGDTSFGSCDAVDDSGEWDAVQFWGCRKMAMVNARRDVRGEERTNLAFVKWKGDV